MPKGQRSGKEAKKPKKDQSPGKPISPDAVTPTITTVVPERSKKKKTQAHCPIHSMRHQNPSKRPWPASKRTINVNIFYQELLTS